MPKIKVKIKKQHRFPQVQTWMDELDLALRRRHEGSARLLMKEARAWEVQKALGDIVPSLGLLEAVRRTLMQYLMGGISGAEGILKKVIAYGQIVGRTGEAGLISPPSVEDVDRLVKAPGWVDNRAVQYALLRAGQNIVTKDSAAVGAMTARLLDGLENRESPTKISRDLALTQGDQDFDGWERIARTETADALQSGIYDEARKLGTAYVYVPTNPAGCESCRSMLHERVFRTDDLSAGSNVKKKRTDWVPCVPLHPNCIDVAIPASQWMIKAALAKVSGTFPKSGVKVEYVPPAARSAA